MKHFQLRFHDRLNVVVLARAYLGADDLTALAEAEKSSATHTIEVWAGSRKVARVKKGNVPPFCEDRLAG